MREGIIRRIYATCPYCGNIEFDREFNDDDKSWDFACLGCDEIIMSDEFGLMSEDGINT